MRAGVPLTDAERAPWQVPVEKICEALRL